jgi:hypothetical protein
MLQTDRGLEFLNAQVQEVFRKNNVHHYYSLNDDIKAAMIERFNRTLKSRLHRYMTHRRTNRWIDALDDVVKSYNSSYHRSIGTAPNDVTPGNETGNRETSLSAEAAAAVQVRRRRPSAHYQVQTRVSERLFTQLDPRGVRHLREIPDVPGHVRAQRFGR